ncbi:TonB-dependent receptor [bacterium]|nr:TonB-dependent receptor [bacterium]
MTRTTKLLLAFMLALPLVFATQADAGTKGKISGTIIDKNTGKPLMGVNVMIRGTMLGAASNLNGQYTILQVPPGIYDVTASMIGYSKIIISKVRVRIDQTSRINFELEVEVVQGETITVIAERKLVKKDVATSVTSFSGEEIKDMPMTSVSDVVGLQAGVDEDLSIRGGSSGEALFQIDGMTMRDARTNQPISGIALSAVQEVSVERGGFNAEYGQVRSGIVNVVTREGDKDSYHGTLTLKASPAIQKHFGMSPYDANSMWMRPYLDNDVCWTGTQNSSWDFYTTRQYPTFEGWNRISESTFTDNIKGNELSPAALQRLFKYQHRKQPVLDKPDYNIDAGFGGPVPLIGRKLGNLRFFTSFRNEKEMYIFPLTRDDYYNYDWSLQLTSDISESIKLKFFSTVGKSYNIAMNGTEQANSTHYIRSPYSVVAAMNQNLQIPGRIFGTGYYSLADVSHKTFSLKLTHMLSINTFYEASIDHISRTYFTRPAATRDTSASYELFDGYFVNEAPFGFSSMPFTSIGDGMVMGGHTSTARDKSKISSTTFKLDLTSQLNFNNLIKSGFEFVYNDLDLDYGVVNLFFPESNTYTNIKETPYRGAFYVQNKLETKGFILNAGLRLDISNSNTSWVDVSAYNKDFFSGLYNDAMDIKKKKSNMEITLSPRMSLSHPITENSKLFFNYGHFKQLPSYEQIFLLSRGATNRLMRFGNPNLALAKTISYELGFDQTMFDEYLIQIAAFYHDIKDQTSTTRYFGNDGTVGYRAMNNNNYEDIRGFEITLRKSTGNWWTGFANYTYRVSSSGNFGIPVRYESPSEQKRWERENPEVNYQSRPIPQPYARISLNMFTPDDFGPELMGFHPLGSLKANLIGEWSSGYWGTWNPQSRPGIESNIHFTDYYNFVLSFHKTFNMKPVNMTVFVEINNLLNTRRLNTENFYDYNDYQDYFNSLHLPKDKAYTNITGDDRPGDYRKQGVDYQPIEQIGHMPDGFTGNRSAIYYISSTGIYMEQIDGIWTEVSRSRMNKIIDDKAYIDMPNMTSFNFLSPRQIFIGIRTSF